MNSSIITILFQYIIFVFIISFISYICNKIYIKFRGYMGEYHLKHELNKLPKNEYIVLNDILIKSNNTTYQLDHIVISKYGVFVIEMKNYFGYIYGNSYKEKWIQKVGKNKRYFYNPIFQNYGHIKALKENLQLDESKFISIICFSNQAKIGIKSNCIITNLSKINKLIKEHNKILLEDNIEHIAKKIYKLNIEDKTERKKHVKMIQENLKNR